MSKGTNKSPVDLVSGKLSVSNDGMACIARVVNGRQFYYYWDTSKQALQTDAMQHTRTALNEAQTQAIAIEKDPAQRPYWENHYKKACAHHRRHPEAYAQFRREEMEAQGVRIRPSSLKFPADLRHYIMSTLMRHAEPWT